MTIIDGRKIAQDIENRLKQEVANIEEPPVLAAILVGEDPASVLYIKIKEKACKEVGIGFQSYQLPVTSEQEKIIELIEKLNSDDKIDAIIIQLPLAKHFDTEKIINAVSLAKDADALNQQSELRSPTVAAILEIFKKYNIDLKNKNICLVGYGRLVGKPLVKELENRGLKLDICDSETKNLTEYTKKADILISATGVPHLITAEMVKKGAVVIDAGTSIEKTPRYKIQDTKKVQIQNFQKSVVSVKTKSVVGDVDFDNVKNKTSYITPPTGGIGPITVAKLLENVMKLTRK